MSCSGVYLYYGYKIQATSLKELFEEDFKIYCNNPDPQSKYKYKFDPYMFEEYVGRQIVDANVNKICVTSLPCCTYEKKGYWIVGKLIADIDGFDMREITFPTANELLQINPVLEKIVTGSKLSQIINVDTVPKIYAIGNACIDCT